MDAFALWETPLVVLRGLEVEPERLARLVAATEGKGVQASNAGGCRHSVPDLALREPELCARIVEPVRRVFDHLAASRGHRTVGLPLDTSIQAWVMVCPTGGYVVPHDHADTSHFSVAWYLDAGDADRAASPDSGRLVFQDPRRVPPTIAGLEIHPTTFTILPETGMMVVFPGWLTHWVHPYRGERPRVCLSANVRLDPQRRSD